MKTTNYLFITNEIGTLSTVGEAAGGGECGDDDDADADALC